MNGSLNSESIENDKEKIKFLLSPSRSSESSESRKNKFDFWKSNIMSICKKDKTAVFDFRKLACMVAIDSRVPRCLDAVVSQMLKEGSLQTLSDFKLACDPSWIAWSAKKFLVKPISWSWKRLVKEPLVSSYKWAFGQQEYNLNLHRSDQVQMPEEDLVLPSLISAIADELYHRHAEQLKVDFTDNILSCRSFFKSCRDIVSDEGLFELAVMDMCRRKLCRVVLNADNDKFLVMLDDSKSSSAMHGNEQKIYRLKMMAEKLEREMESLEVQVIECKQTAKELLKEGKKKMALSMLKKKKMLEGRMEEKHASIEKVSSLLSLIQQAEHNKQVYDVFSSGVEAIKGMQKRGLTEEKVEETLMQVQEALEQNQEINQMISRPMDGGDWQDEELEEELNEFMASHEAEKQIEDLASLLDLPPVPKHDPISPTSTPPRATRKSQRSFERT